MDERQLHERIQLLVDHEHEMTARHGTDGLSEDEQQELGRVEVELDQAWDLLRQRRARRHAGLDPDDAAERNADTVERYQQ